MGSEFKLKTSTLSVLISDNISTFEKQSFISSYSNGTIAIISGYGVLGKENTINRQVYVLNKLSIDTEHPFGRWEAISGAYSADNVYFPKDMIFTGNYTLGVKKEKTTDNFILSAGKSVTDLFTELFYSPTTPSVLNPYVTIKIDDVKDYEVGTVLTSVGYTATFYEGSYQFGPKPTGVSCTLLSVVNNTTSEILNTSTGKFGELSVLDDTSFKVSALAFYTDGLSAYDSLKRETSVHISAGSFGSGWSSEVITGYRNIFVGTISVDSSAIDETIIKDLKNFKYTDNFSDKATNAIYIAKDDTKGSHSVKFNENPKCIVLAIPKFESSQKDLKEVFDWVNNTTLDIDKTFIKKDDIDVSGATLGQNKKKYMIYVYAPDTGEIDPGRKLSLTIK